MKRKYILPLIAFLFLMQACDPTKKEVFTIIPEETVWSNEGLALSALANLYSQLPSGDFDEELMQVADEAMWGGSGDGLNTTSDIGTTRFGYWNYGFLRNIHLFINKAQASASLSESTQKRLIAEARFLKAYFYFELVKRMGGVPLVKEVLYYKDPNDIPNLQIPRAKEEEVYDFIASELDAIASDLPEDVSDKSRATKWVALALKCRAMLYAGSLAKYNNLMPVPVTLPGGEVGIPVARANDYYQAALNAAQQIINSGKYAITNDYFGIFNQNRTSSEMIMAVFYKLPGKVHWFTYNNIFPSAREDNMEGGHITPVFELANAYDNLDGSATGLVLNSGSNPVFYNNPQDMFADKDKRLEQTIVYPGLEFRNTRANIQAGLVKWNTSTSQYDTLRNNTAGSNDGVGNTVIGFDGPTNQINVTNSGFYIRKFISTTPGSGARSSLADNWWPLFRYAEVLLNAGEAALELGRAGDAKGYVDELRTKHGGITTPLATLTWDKYINERRIELAFEGHRYWDLKRWRIAESVLNGSARLTGLYPYKIYHPGDPNHQKWIYRRVAPSRITQAKRFTRENYYTFIGQGILNSNPKLVRNPGQ